MYTKVFMQYTKEDTDEVLSLKKSLETVLSGLGFALIELVFSKQRTKEKPEVKKEKAKGRIEHKERASGSIVIRIVIYNNKGVSIDDCSKAHRAVTPRLELAFEGQDIYLEVSSPGTDRNIKYGEEFKHFLGKGVRCYRTDISDWTFGILESVDENGVVLKMINDNIIKNKIIESVRLEFDIIAKAKLSGQTLQEV